MDKWMEWDTGTLTQTAIQSPDGHNIALYDCCPISLLLFCCDGCLLSFYVFHFNCQSVCRKQEGQWVCAADPDGPSTKREFVREPGSSYIHSGFNSRPNSVWFPLSPFINMALNIFEHGCESMWCTQPLCFGKKNLLIFEFHNPDLFKSLHPLCWSVPGQNAESLAAYTVADPDLWLLEMRANEKTNSPHAINPFTGRIWLDCSFKSESCYVSGSTSSPVFLPSLCTCWRWGRRTSLAPACFASVTIYQATIKAEGSPLAPRSRCVYAAARGRGHDMNAALTLG